MKLLLILSFFLCPYYYMYGQEKKDTINFRVVSYNIENMFDYKHDSLKNDYEFLPDAIRHWNYTKYKKKLNNISRVITAVGGWSPPALVALCEVENDRVMRDLTRYSILRESHYRYVMTQSDDERGVDVALLYQRGLFKLLSYQSLKVDKPRGKSRPTRDILHVSGLLLTRDTLDVFVVHFPSRFGGIKASQPYRLLAAQKLKETTDSIIEVRCRPQILILGDFNDYPNNKSIKQTLQAKAPPSNSDSLSTQKLYHLLARKADKQKDFGSYKFQGEWGLLDHIIVSGCMLQPDSPFYTNETKADVFSPTFILTDDNKNGGKQPYRTYLGMRYQAGYSDHLPVWADFRLIY